MTNKGAIIQITDTLAFWEYLHEPQSLNFSSVKAETSRNFIFNIFQSEGLQHP